MFNSEIATIIDFHSKIIKENLLPKSDASLMKITQLADKLIDYVFSHTQIRDKFDTSLLKDVHEVLTSFEKENEWKNIPPTLASDVILIAVTKNLLVRYKIKPKFDVMKHWARFSNYYYGAVCRTD